MNYYKINEETYKAYEHLINIFKACNIDLYYSTATDCEDRDLIAREIYCHFGTHYFKCINSLKGMRENGDYKNIISDIEGINILDIGCNIGTATYAYIDNYLENKDDDYAGNINVIFIEMSGIRVKWLEEMFNVYVKEIHTRYSNLNISYTIINESFPVELDKIENNLISAPLLILISNFTRWNKESVLAEKINELFMIDEKTYLLNIETESQLKKINDITNYMKKYKVYSITGPLKKSKFKYNNLKCSVWKKGNEYTYNKSYYQTNIKEQDMYEYINNRGRMRDIVNKTINTLNSFIITDEIEVNYLIRNKMNIIDISRKILNAAKDIIYSCNYMEFDIPKKDNTTRPLIIEDSISELISTSIITSIGLCIDNIQNENISFGNRLEEKDEVPYVTKKFMEQYFNKFISNQKEVKKNKEYKYYAKLDLKEYYKNINHEKLLEILNDYLNRNTWFKEKEWFLDIVRNYINRKGNGKGIPQGLPLSGILSNIYLNSYDNWFKENFGDDKIFRYVDDMIIFSNSFLDKNISNYTSFITNELKLMLNENKTEQGNVESLEFYDLDSSYEQISKKCKEIYSAIYNLPSSVYNLYIKNNEELINLLFKSLSSIGIYISKSWLSKKVRKKRRYYSGININYGKMYGKGNIDIDKWKKEFVNKNKRFMEQLNILNNILEEEFNNLYAKIRNGDNSTLTIRKFKFIYNKLGTFVNKNIINAEVFDYIYSHPWLIDMKKLRGYSNLKSKVFNNINQEDTSYCNLVLIWLIGEYEATEYLGFIWNIYIDTLQKYTGNLRLLNTKACETILKLLKNQQISIDKIEQLKYLYNSKLNDTFDYIYIRNMIMILNVLDHEWLIKNNKSVQLSLELEGVLKYAKDNFGENIIEVLEPMYNNYGQFLPDEEPMGNINSSY